jgi:hypothetical protein
MVKECDEEASIPRAIAEKVNVKYQFEQISVL